MKKLFRKEVIIGLSVIAALVVLIFGIDFLKGINVFKASNYYYATYTDVKGLSNSAPVTVNGFKVGQVRDIEYLYDNPGHVLVEISLDKELRVPAGTKAVLQSDLLGTASIRLDMSASHDYHEVGDHLIGVSEESLVENLSGVAGDMLPSVGGIVPKVDTMITSINTLVGDPALLTSIRRFNSITDNLAKSSATLNQSMSSLPPIMHDVKQLSSNAAQMSSQLSQLLAEVHETYKDSRIDSTLYNIYITTENLKALSADLRNPNSTLGKLMNDPELYNSLTVLLAHLDTVVVDFKRQPKRYVPPIKVF